MYIKNTVPLITEEIGWDDLHVALRGLQMANSNNLLLGSNGGRVSNLLYFRDHVANRKMTIVGAQIVGSLALNFFLYGETRLATPESTFLLHECRWTLGGEEVTKGEAQMRALLHEYNRDFERYHYWSDVHQKLTIFDQITIELMSQKTNLSAYAVAKLIREESYFDVDCALHYGIIHDVVDAQQIALLPQLGVFEPW
jgi:ATP-dependent protease ClpP protease subunit